MLYRWNCCKRGKNTAHGGKNETLPQNVVVKSKNETSGCLEQVPLSSHHRTTWAGVAFGLPWHEVVGLKSGTSIEKKNVFIFYYFFHYDDIKHNITL